MSPNPTFKAILYLERYMLSPHCNLNCLKTITSNSINESIVYANLETIRFRTSILTFSKSYYSNKLKVKFHSTTITRINLMHFFPTMWATHSQSDLQASRNSQNKSQILSNPSLVDTLRFSSQVLNLTEHTTSSCSNSKTTQQRLVHWIRIHPLKTMVQPDTISHWSHPRPEIPEGVNILSQVAKGIFQIDHIKIKEQPYLKSENISENCTQL